MNSFYNYKGLINARADDSLNVNENSFLYSLEYLFRNKMDDDLVYNMIKYLTVDMRNEVRGKVLYRNVLFGTGLLRDQYTSRDQLIAYAIFSVLIGGSVHHEIYNHIKKHWYTYDNLSGKVNFKRFVAPWDVVFLGILCQDKTAISLENIFFYKGLDTYKRGGVTETSGELLVWTQMQILLKLRYPSAIEWMKRYEGLMMKRFGQNCWGKAFAVYFPETGHPNVL